MGRDDARTAAATPWLAGGDLDREEVRELWAHLHGDIMAPGIRRQLRRSMGFCVRHTWAYAVAEIELWEHGAGLRRGHQPFDTCVLYEDLLDEALARLRPARLTPRRRLDDILAAREPCRICVALAEAPGSGTGPRQGFAGSDPLLLTREANLARFTQEWCQETFAVWAPALCSRCAESSALPERYRPDPGAAGEAATTCRPHLLATAGARDRATTAAMAAAVAARLESLRPRLRSLLASMTQAGRPSTSSEDASWVEVLGWFSGFAAPLALVAAPRRG